MCLQLFRSVISFISVARSSVCKSCACLAIVFKMYRVCVISHKSGDSGWPGEAPSGAGRQWTGSGGKFTHTHTHTHTLSLYTLLCLLSFTSFEQLTLQIASKIILKCLNKNPEREIETEIE